MKRFLLIALACIMLFALSACNEDTTESSVAESGEAQSKAEQTKEPDLADVKAEMANQLEITVSDMHTAIMVGMYGLPEDGIAENASFTVDGPVFREEIFMIKATDSEKAAAIAEKLQKHLDDLKKQSKNYSPESAAILEKCSVLTNGNYVAMFFSEDRARLEEIYNSAF